MGTNMQEASGLSTAPNTVRRESAASPGKLLLIFLSLVCESNTDEGHDKLSNPLFEKNDADKITPVMWMDVET